MTNENEQIAKTILKQLGGNRFAAMVGVKQLGYDGPSLRVLFKAKAKNGANMIVIRYNSGKDLYDIEFSKVRGLQPVKSIKKIENVFDEMLAQIFETETGLFTKF